MTKYLLFQEKDSRLDIGKMMFKEMGRTAAELQGEFSKGDRIVSAEVLQKGVKDREVLVVTENGFKEVYPSKRLQNSKTRRFRYKTVKVTDKTGEVVAGLISKEEREEGELVDEQEGASD